MTRTRVKFCGLRRTEDVDAAVAAGVDAVGFVLAPRTPRCLTREEAAVLRRRLPPFVQAVVLFCNAEEACVRAAVATLQPDLLQFHGEEPPAFCASFGRPYLKAVPMRSGVDLTQWERDYEEAAALVVDAHAPGEPGGQGISFDWTRIGATQKRLILAGGLTPENVRQAVRQVHPYAVDVSTGIERSPGVKDIQRMRRFIEEVRNADAA